MEEYPEIIYSPLSQKYTSNNKAIEIFIYKTENEKGWILEIEDEKKSSSVWQEFFETDQSALDEAIKTIKEEGIDLSKWDNN